MDAMEMLKAAAYLLVLAALGGVVMAGIRFLGKHNPPAWMAMGHGLLAGAGITLLAYAALAGGVPGLAAIALLLFLLAAAGGVLMNLHYQWNRRLLPAPLLVVHALTAIAAFVLLLAAAWMPGR